MATVQFEDLVTSLVASLSPVISSDVHKLSPTGLHVSVSRTVAIRHYWIDTLVQQLRYMLQRVRRYRKKKTNNSASIYRNCFLINKKAILRRDIKNKIPETIIIVLYIENQKYNLHNSVRTQFPSVPYQGIPSHECWGLL